MAHEGDGVAREQQAPAQPKQTRSNKTTPHCALASCLGSPVIQPARVASRDTSLAPSRANVVLAALGGVTAESSPEELAAAERRASEACGFPVRLEVTSTVSPRGPRPPKPKKKATRRSSTAMPTLSRNPELRALVRQAALARAWREAIR